MNTLNLNSAVQIFPRYKTGLSNKGRSITRLTFNYQKEVILESTGNTNFWIDKSPCWEMCHCPALIREECPASIYQFLPYWEIEGTYCKLDDHDHSGKDISICEVCRVYKKYGKNEPIELKLLGRGIDSSLKSLEKTAKL